MKLRNQLLALFCLLLFVGIGVVYVRTWVFSKSSGVVLFMSDGLVPRHLTAARLYEGGAEYRLALDAFPHLALLRNPADDFAVPDAASAGTALATGQKVRHRQLAIDPEGRPLRTLLEIAREKGRAVGIVTNGQLTDPALAAFYAHSSDARDQRRSAAQFVAARIDVALGGGAAIFAPQEKDEGKLPDLIAKMQEQRRQFVRTRAELENSGGLNKLGLIGLFSDADLAHADQIEAGSQQPSLSDMVRRAIEILQTASQGYVLVVDAALLSRAAERNEGERVIHETVALDLAIATAVKYAGEKSLIIAAGRHSIGGMSLNGYPLKQDHGVALLGVNPAGYPAITWATGPSGPGETQTAREKTEPAAFFTPSAVHTAEDVLALGRGAGAEKLHGFLENTDIFKILRNAL